MNKNLLKTLLLTAIFAMGASSLWADDEEATTNTLYEAGTEDVPWTEDLMNAWTADSALILTDYGIMLRTNNKAVSATKKVSPTDNSIITVEATWLGMSNTGRYLYNGNASYFRFGNIYILENDQDKSLAYSLSTFSSSNYTSFSDANTTYWRNYDYTERPFYNITMVINTATSTLTSLTVYREDSETALLTLEDQALSDADYTTIGIGYARSGSVSDIEYELLQSIKVTEEEQTVETASYTLKYVDESGESIAEDVTLTGVVDSEITLADSYKEDFFNDDETIKYIYSSDDSDGKTIASDNSTEVTITYRVAGTYSYALYASVNGETTELGSGSYFEGETVYVPYPYYMNSDGTLYYYSATSSQYRYPITLESASNEVTLTYTESTITNVIFLSEGEDIDGVTIINSGNSEIRSSNAASGSSEGEDVTIITLPAGTYTIAGAYYAKSTGLSLTLDAGETELFSATTTGTGTNWTSFSVEVSIDETTAITFNSSSNMAIDFVYVVAESYAKTIPSYGYVSFSAPLAVEVPEEVTVYKATNVGDDAVTLEEVSASVIPANEGVILGGDAADYTLAVTSDDTDGDFSSNILIASSVYPTVGSDDNGYTTYYGLNKDAEDEAEFAVITTGITLSTNKAYLGISGESSAKTLKITFGSTTGISEAAVESASSDGAIYSLQGIKVSSPSKGLYIQDGKKVIIK